VVSGIGSPRRHWVELAWVAFAALNVLAILVFTGLDSIPFHFIWVSLTIVYGYRVWSGRATMGVLVAVSLVTGAALVFAVARSGEGFDEVVEVPLMAAMFGAMVWHARRRQAAVEEARRLAEEQGRLLQRQREFVRDASHELRTPITIALGHAELLRASLSEPQGLHDADVVVDELGRLSRLSERLLLLAAAEHADLLAVDHVDPGALVEETLRRWRPTAPRRWELAVDLVAGTTVLADPDRLRDALDALIENALKATAEDDVIRLSAGVRDDGLILDVADSGVGIDPDLLPLLFDRFSRTDQPRSRHAGGTGLGLPIVKAIAEAHGGSVEVESLPGQGTSIRMLIPGLRTGAPADGPPVVVAG
jgi:signal transduction histidine kinase